MTNEIERQCRQCGFPLRGGRTTCPDCGLSDQPLPPPAPAAHGPVAGFRRFAARHGWRLSIPLLLGALVLIGVLIEFARAMLRP